MQENWKIFNNNFLNPFDLLFIPIRSFKYFNEQKFFYNEAKLSDEEFLKKYKDINEKIRIGVSWSNKYFIEKLNLKGYREQKDEILRALKFLTEDLGIKLFRLKLDWDQIQVSYDKLQIPDIDIITFDYLFSRKVQITLNIGPIKTFRYPEMHLPEMVFNKLAIPLYKEFIFNGENPIALEAYEYLDSLSQLISEKFRKELDSKLIHVIQLDNEPKSRFGKYKWLLTDEYMLKTYEIVSKYFTKQRFLINSPFIPFNIKEIFQPDIKLCTDFIKKLLDRVRLDLIIGINFYNYVPNIPKIPILNIYPDNYSIFESLYGPMLQLKKFLHFEFQVTESQFEPWGDKYPFTIPGSSIEHLKYSLLRHLMKLVPLNKFKTDVYLWGIEHFIINQKNNKELTKFIRNLL